MGMGEPLANFGNLMASIGIINAPWGVGLGARHITISTSGLAPQIRLLAEQPLQVRLAVSLHGATDAVREGIMPVNRKYPVKQLLEAPIPARGDARFPAAIRLAAIGDGVGRIRRNQHGNYAPFHVIARSDGVR